MWHDKIKGYALCGRQGTSEMDKEVVSSCSWVDKRLRSMNDIDVSCKWVGILLCVQLWFLSKSWCPSISRSSIWMLFLGLIWERSSHSSIRWAKGKGIGSDFESLDGGVEGSSCTRSTCHTTYVPLMWCQWEIISELVVPISSGRARKGLYRIILLQQNGSKVEESKAGMESQLWKESNNIVTQVLFQWVFFSF